MADRCVFFDDLLLVAEGRQRLYVVHERPGTGLTCIDARMRRGGEWLFARRWIRTHAGARELYRAIDRLEAAGFRFHVAPAPRRGGPTPAELAGAEWDELRVRASDLQNDLTATERRVHAELFPDEHDLLARGYDWDHEHVYRAGAAISPDAFGRTLEVDGDVLYEWVCVPDEFTWRRYPLERVRVSLTARGT